MNNKLQQKSNKEMPHWPLSKTPGSVPGGTEVKAEDVWLINLQTVSLWNGLYQHISISKPVIDISDS